MLRFRIPADWHYAARNLDGTIPEAMSLMGSGVDLITEEVSLNGGRPCYRLASMVPDGGDLLGSSGC
ncbi:hypothetical protein ACKVWM_003439 [Pyricularia oryzae]